LVASFTINNCFAEMPTAAFDQQQIPNTNVLDQAGEGRQFYTDLVEGKIVAVNFIFTSCEMICPLFGYKFGQLRRLLGEDAGKTHHLISITTDAPFDTPAKLKQWAGQFNDGPGWTLLTGSKQDVDGLLKKLEAFAVDKIDHTTLVLLINDLTGQLKWIDGNSDPEVLLTELKNW
jgi:protein SCO1/2